MDKANAGRTILAAGRSGKGRNPEFVRQITEAILLHPELTATQAKVLAFMWSKWGNAEGYMWPSLRTVARYMRVHERKIRGHIDQAVEAGVVRKTRRIQDDGRFGTNRLELDLDGLLDSLPDDLASDVHPNPVPQQFVAPVAPIRPELFEVAQRGRESFSNPDEGVPEQDAPPAHDRPAADDRPEAGYGPTVQRPGAGRTEPGTHNQGEEAVAVADGVEAVEQVARENESALVGVEQGKVIIKHAGIVRTLAAVGSSQGQPSSAVLKRFERLVLALHSQERLDEFDEAMLAAPPPAQVTNIYGFLEPVVALLRLPQEVLDGPG